MTRNEAAERLRELVETGTIIRTDGKLIDAALAEERRHVIEQIRATQGDPFPAWLDDLLDDPATEGLDVERLRRAFRWMSDGPDGMPDGRPDFDATATEYARLSSPGNEE